MTNKLYTVAGISLRPQRDKGMSKVRFSRDISRRVKTLMRQGATRCDLITLPTEMTKVDALKYMMTLPQFANPADQATLADALNSRIPQPKGKRGRKPKEKDKHSIEAIKERSRKKATTTSEDILAAVAE